MKIDCHVHAFPDGIAERAMKKLSDTAGFPHYSLGTETDTRRILKECGVDYGVLLPIATKPTQQTSINNWAAELNKGNLISFGTVHPDNEAWLDELDRIKELGLKGVKLHPDYQGFFLFEERLIPFWQRCEELELPVTIHMGYDPVTPTVRRAMPQDLVYVHSKVPNVNIIAAHMGGVFAWEAAYHYVCGDRHIWLDTAFTEGFLQPELMKKLIEKHGADRVLFASDLPWHLPSMEEGLIEKLDLSDRELDRIYWENTAELLKLSL